MFSKFDPLHPNLSNSRKNFEKLCWTQRRNKKLVDTKSCPNFRKLNFQGLKSPQKPKKYSKKLRNLEREEVKKLLSSRRFAFEAKNFSEKLKNYNQKVTNNWKKKWLEIEQKKSRKFQKFQKAGPWLANRLSRPRMGVCGLKIYPFGANWVQILREV